MDREFLVKLKVRPDERSVGVIAGVAIGDRRVQFDIGGKRTTRYGDCESAASTVRSSFVGTLPSVRT